MSAHHQDHAGVFGAILGFLSYVLGHFLKLLPQVEEVVPAMILAAMCALVGAMVTTGWKMFIKWISK